MDPILFLARGHSGTRMISQLLEKCNVFMGTKRTLNPAYDSEVFDFGFQRVLLPKNFEYGKGCTIKTPDEVKKLFDSCLKTHLNKYSGQWGFKTCALMFCFPIYNLVLPDAKYIEIKRDSKDVILSNDGRINVTNPNGEWRRNYWDYYKITTFGISNDQDSFKYFKDDPNDYNFIYKNRYWIQAKSCIEHELQLKILWDKNLVNKNNTLKISYEKFCLDPVGITEEICDFLGLKLTEQAINFCKEEVYTGSIGKWKSAGLSEINSWIERKTDEIYS